MIRRHVLQAKLQSASHKIDNQWPFVIAVAVPSHDSDSRPNRAELVENGLHANIAKVPDFISVPGNFRHFVRQTIVRVRHDENTQDAFRFLRRCHIGQSCSTHCYAPRVPAACLDARVDLRDGECYVASPSLP